MRLDEEKEGFAAAGWHSREEWSGLGTPRRVSIVTLGCKVNSAESEGIKTLFAEAGYLIVDPEVPADVCVINTCTVTQAGARKSRQMIRRLRSLNPNAIVVATGCYAQVATDEVASVGGMDLVVGNNRKHEMVSLVASTLKDRMPGDEPVLAVMARREMTAYESLPVSDWSGHTRAFLKVQDGCDRFCSYCIIPYARGPVRSRPVADAVDEVNRLIARGFSEFVLTGIHLAAYHDKEGNSGLPALLSALDSMPGVRRIRLGSLEPFTLTPSFLDTLRLSGKLCPHFHISLQSGSDSVLQRMNRRYSAAQFATMLKEIRDRFPDVSLTTDVMVGFPGETEEEFEASRRFCEIAGFSWLHVFPYSARPGTPAAAAPEQVPKAVREARAARMGSLSNELKAAHLSGFVGRTLEVLLEQADPKHTGLMEGFTQNYLPVCVPADAAMSGRYVTVRIHAATRETLMGTLCDGTNC